MDNFYDGVSAFFIKVINYALDRLPFKDDVVQNVGFVDFKRDLTVTSIKSVTMFQGMRFVTGISYFFLHKG